ncbi:MAG: 4a-hydroxytetrahydrobiopterin dehydratase [Acidimicrobiales bacterium]
MASEVLTGDEIRATDRMDDWRPLYAAIEARYRTGDFGTGLALVNRIGEAAEAANHHPDLKLTYGHVDVLLTSHDAGGLTSRDVALARTISGIAADLGVAADPGSVQRVELALDTWDADEIRPFWAAVLAIDPTAEGELADPAGVHPTVWFQDATADTDQRWHLDLRVPPEVADQRIAAALAAGGSLVSDASAPSFTVLADAQGNQVCVCTHVGRGT